MGLTWDKVHISDDNIKSDNAYLEIKYELARVDKKVMKMLNEKDVIFVFPDVLDNTKTCLVLKTVKTKASVRKVWLSKTVAYMLRDWKKSQDRTKKYLGRDYNDYDLIFALGDGRPCQNRVIEKAFKKLKEKAQLPNVVFHFLRNSSTTYKLKMTNGDLKAVQGDTGHAEIDMITKVYAHILDKDRNLNAQKFDNDFYVQEPDLRQSNAPKETKSLDLNDLLLQLKNSPELSQMLAEIVSS